MNERRRKRIEKNILKNRKYKTLIYNRVILTVALVLLQIVQYGLMVASFYTSGWTVLLAVVIVLAALTAYLAEIRRRIAALDEREPEHMRSEAYDEWSEAHEQLEDLADDILDRIEE